MCVGGLLLRWWVNKFAPRERREREQIGRPGSDFGVWVCVRARFDNHTHTHTHTHRERERLFKGAHRSCEAQRLERARTSRRPSIPSR